MARFKGPRDNEKRYARDLKNVKPSFVMDETLITGPQAL